MLLLLVAAPISRAQPAPTEALVKAAVLVRIFDRLSVQCKAGKGFNEKQSAAIATWEAEQNVNNIRTQLRSFSSQMQQKIEQSSTRLTARLSQLYSPKNSCEIATVVITSPVAKFATSNSTLEPRTNPNPKPTVTTPSSSEIVK
jgi:hypothetical protein